MIKLKIKTTNPLILLYTFLNLIENRLYKNLKIVLIAEQCSLVLFCNYK